MPTNRLTHSGRIDEPRCASTAQGDIIRRRQGGQTMERLVAGEAGMHTVELLEYALVVARKLGYQVREEWLAGQGGGHCLLRGEKWIFLDLAHTRQEQLNQVLEALRNDPGIDRLRLPPALSTSLKIRRPA